MFAQRIAGGAGPLGDDGRFVAGQGVEQGGLADIGLADDGDGHALAQATTLSGLLTGFREQRFRRRQALHQSGVGEPVDVLVGKIQRTFDEHPQVGQLRGEGLQAPGEGAFEGLLRGAHRLAGSGVDEIGNGLGLGEVEAAVEVGAFGEFSGLGDAGSGRDRRAQQFRQQHRTAVALQLHDVFAGEGVRALEAQYQALVEYLALGVAQRAQGCLPWGRQRAREVARNCECLRPRQADYADRTATRRGGNGGDGVDHGRRPAREPTSASPPWRPSRGRACG